MKATKIAISVLSLIVIASTLVFRSFIEINAASICPAFLIFLSLIQTVTFASASSENSPHDTAYSENNTLTPEEFKLLCKIHTMAKVLIIPMLVVFIFFFSTLWKLLIPIVIYVASFLVAKVVFVKKRS